MMAKRPIIAIMTNGAAVKFDVTLAQMIDHIDHGRVVEGVLVSRNANEKDQAVYVYAAHIAFFYEVGA